MVVFYFNQNPAPVTSEGVPFEPLSALEKELPADFLTEEIDFGKTVGDTFSTGDLAVIWKSPKLLSALIKHPSALSQIKKVAELRGIKIESVKVADVMHCLGVTQDFLWDKNIDTVEELLSHYNEAENLVKQDISSAFLSTYGINLAS